MSPELSSEERRAAIEGARDADVALTKGDVRSMDEVLDEMRAEHDSEVGDAEQTAKERRS